MGSIKLWRAMILFALTAANQQARFYALGVRSDGDWGVTITSNDVPWRHGL